MEFLADEFELPPHGREGLDEGEAADFHKFCCGLLGEISARHAFGVLFGGWPIRRGREGDLAGGSPLGATLQ